MKIDFVILMILVINVELNWSEKTAWLVVFFFVKLVNKKVIWNNGRVVEDVFRIKYLSENYIHYRQKIWEYPALFKKTH